MVSKRGKEPGVQARRSTKDFWLDQFLFAKGEGLRGLADDAQTNISRYEKANGLRKRRRKPQDQASFNAAVETIIVNLAYAALIDRTEPRPIVVPRDKRSKRIRYDRHELKLKTTLYVIGMLSHTGMLSTRTGRVRKGASTIKATPSFSSRVLEAGVTFHDFGRYDEELIILSMKPPRPNGGRKGSAKQLPYEDTEETKAYRAQVAKLNSFLADADITFIDDTHLLDRDGEPREPVDPYERRLRRYFSSKKFNLHGRLYGGFWIGLQRERRTNIRINGEPPADLDYQGCFLGLAYAHAGHDAPLDDPYDLNGFLTVPGYDNDTPGHREAVKKAFNSLLNGGRAGSKEIISQLPEGTNARQLREALAAKHPKICHMLGKNIGLALMFTESRMLLHALERLMTRGIVALGIHDGLLVAQPHQEAAKSAMEEAAFAITGRRMPVVVKPLAPAEAEIGFVWGNQSGECVGYPPRAVLMKAFCCKALENYRRAGGGRGTSSLPALRLGRL